MPRTVRLSLAAATLALGAAPLAPAHAVACNPLVQVVCRTAGTVCRDVLYDLDQNVHSLACTWSS